MDNTDLRPGWASAQLSSTPEEDEENFPEIPSSHSLESNMPSYKRTCPHRLFRCYKFITMMTAFLVMVAQALSVVCVPFDGIGLVIKVFLTSFCVLIILNELEWWKMLRDSPLFSNWIARGVSCHHVLVKLLTMPTSHVFTSHHSLLSHLRLYISTP